MTAPGENMVEYADGKCRGTIQSGPRKGEPCRARPKTGSVLCGAHGGHLPKVKRAAQFRLARDEAQQELIRRMKDDRQGRQDAVTELDRLAAEVIVFKDICRERIEQLNQIRYEGKTGEQIRAEIILYERALDRCNTVLATNIKLGIAERKQKLDEAQALLMVGVIKTILNRLDLSREQKAIAVKVVPEELRAISAAVQAS